MTNIKIIKFRTALATKFAKLTPKFNRRIKGVKACYNLNYRGDKSKFHTLDVIYQTHSERLPCVIYFHGGGWSVYDKSVFRTTCKRFASKGAVVFNCNFRQSPEFTIADMQDDITSILDFVRKVSDDYCCNPDKLIFSGDSSGAHLLSLFINRAVQNGDKEISDRVKACVYFYGVYDLTTVKETKNKKFITYLNTVLPEDTLDYNKKLIELSPVNYVSGDLPPTLICSGRVDVLNKFQSERYAEILKNAGVEVQTLIFPEDCKAGKHRFITFDKNEAAVKSFEAFGEFLNKIS